MKTELTARQREIYEFIRFSIEKRGIPPSMREIGEKFGIRSTNGVEGHLAALERQGLIARERGKSRGISLPGRNHALATIPRLGRVTAGMPVLSPENREGELAVDLSLFSLRNAHNIFALGVRGDSMIDAHIMDGDTLLIRAQPVAESGDIVVALVNGEATVKRLFLEKGRVRLQPENKALKPIYVDQGDLSLAGKVVGVIRRV